MLLPKATTDFEYPVPSAGGELWGVADRTDYDLKQHQNTSGKDMTYFDQETGEHIIPYVIEPSLGADRVTLAFLCDAYDEEVVGQDKNGKDDVRAVMHFHPALAPFKVAVPPPRSWAPRPRRFILSSASTSWWTTTTPAASASATAVRTRSAPLLRYLGL